jgi:hypothetical protein
LTSLRTLRVLASSSSLALRNNPDASQHHIHRVLVKQNLTSSRKSERISAKSVIFIGNASCRWKGLTTWLISIN